MALRVVSKAFEALSSFIESFQVELHGRYSAEKLEGFLQYSRSTGLLRVAAVLALTAVPCALVIIVTDLLPLQPPSAGLAGQTITYWVRTFFSILVITWTTFVQWSHASPRLHVWPAHFAFWSCVVSLETALILLALHIFVGFPTPFLYHTGSAPWQVLVALTLWMMWKKAVRSDPELKADLARYLYLWVAEVTMIVVYPVFGYIYGHLSGQYQTMFSLVLPLWKILLRNWCNYGSFRREDLAPVLVVFNVDVFHALFLASAMQSSSTSGSNTVAVVMTVDFVQSCIAVYEVWRVRTAIEELAVQIEAVKGSEDVVVARNGSTFERAATILVNSRHTREHPTIVKLRHCQSTTKVSVDRGPDPLFYKRLLSSAKVGASDLNVNQLQSASCPHSSSQQLGELKVEYVRLNLKVLYVVEFYMLIEFTEVVVTVVYVVYLFAMSHLPNRKFYFPLKHLSGDEFTETVHYVIKYAALEMVSFLVLAIVLSRMLRVSTMRQLAFVLEKEWLLVQTFLVLWVFFPTQMSLEHLGCDYTFKFAWLHHSAKGV